MAAQVARERRPGHAAPPVVEGCSAEERDRQLAQVIEATAAGAMPAKGRGYA